MANDDARERPGEAKANQQKTSRGLVLTDLPRLSTEELEKCQREFAESFKILERKLNPFAGIAKQLAGMPSITKMLDQQIGKSLIERSGLFDNYTGYQAWLRTFAGSPSVMELTSRQALPSSIFDAQSALGFDPGVIELGRSIAEQFEAMDTPSHVLTDLSRKVSFPLQGIVDTQLALSERLGGLAHMAASTIFSFEHVNRSLSSLEAISRHFSLPSQALEMALAPTAAYQGFAARQLDRVETDARETAARRLVVLEFAGDLLEETQTVIELTLVVTPSGQRASSAPMRDRVNLYSSLNQHIGHVYVCGSSVDVAQAFDRATPARINRLGNAIMQLVGQLILYAERGADDPVFKPTSRTMRACAAIPNAVANGEEEFGTVVDHLFFLLYEGSGSAKRLTRIVDDETLEPLWLLKDLRLDFRHDIDHGKESDIRRKRKNVKEAYERLIGRPPARPGDWTRAQLALYELLLKMVEEISDVVLMD